METYPADLEAGQIVRWLLEEQRHGRLKLHVLAIRSYVEETLADAETQGLSIIAKSVQRFWRKNDATTKDSKPVFVGRPRNTGLGDDGEDLSDVLAVGVQEYAASYP